MEKEPSYKELVAYVMYAKACNRAKIRRLRWCDIDETDKNYWMDLAAKQYMQWIIDESKKGN